VNIPVVHSPGGYFNTIAACCHEGCTIEKISVCLDGKDSFAMVGLPDNHLQHSWYPALLVLNKAKKNK
jgi:hypothetical protein